ncbi:hypothetical protein LINPERHAP2_LOCUS33543 [Linum perenne]
MCWNVRKSIEVVYWLYISSTQTNQRIYFIADPHRYHQIGLDLRSTNCIMDIWFQGCCSP